ncbi:MULTISPECIES: hypothetical protein [unclassified Nocardiopsis]|uniref:hypothetical protein n=1 Tax=Nocardiopsis TaxID=2013 RepID=UPI00387B6AA6
MRQRDHEEDTDEKIERILTDLSPRERERLMAVVAVGMEPKRLIAPLTERLVEVFQEHADQELSPQQAREIARLALVENMGARQTHLSQLAQLLQDVEKQKGAGDPRVLSRRILDFCRASGLKKVTDTEDLARYRVVAGHPGPGTVAKVVSPAFVDEISGRLIVSGEVLFQEAKPEKKNGKGWA